MATFTYSKEQVLKLLDKNKKDTLTQIEKGEQEYRKRLVNYLELLPEIVRTWVQKFDIDVAIKAGHTYGPRLEPPQNYDISGQRLYTLRQRIPWLESIRRRIELIDSKDGRIRISDKDDVWRALISE